MTRTAPLPGERLSAAKMPGHWLLARLGKRVLRPGGLETTHALLKALSIGNEDDVVEFAPGLGGTAQLILGMRPKSYTGLERDHNAASFSRQQLREFPDIDIRVGAADASGLPNGAASVVIGEAMLSMNTVAQKAKIAAEAFRLLRPGGRYGIHELKIAPNSIERCRHAEIERALSSEIHVGPKPLTSSGWQSLLTNAGFEVDDEGSAPMHLLRPDRMIADEGILGTLNIAKNVALNPGARRRVFAMRKVFERYQDNLGAIYLIGRKPG
ncbi:MAG: class I SAM-dependent methyltransferase [Pseudomonadota bacterium]